MKKSLLAVSWSLFVLIAAGQTEQTAKKSSVQLTETTIVKDSIGTVYSPAIWRQLLMTGRYDLQPENPKEENTAFIIKRLTDEQYEHKMKALPKPRESAYFKKGSKFSYFKTSDINGNKLNSKNLSGKIVVLNYWFINCPPCRAEIPELNKIAEKFKGDSSVVFIAVALDGKQQLEDFLKKIPFKYTIVDDGRYVANEYSINAYPTNVIIDTEGKVYFHSSGFAINMGYWLEKSILEIKQSVTKKELAVSRQ